MEMEHKMGPVYSLEYTIDDLTVDRFGVMKPSAIMFLAQEASGQHCVELSLSYETLASRRLFWAVIRQQIQISRLPRRGEKLRIETWPMPTTRVAYPRSVVAYDARGEECFRSVSLWVLMDMDSRNMILPGKSGVEVAGTLRGTELAAPSALPLGKPESLGSRTVSFTDLDRNGHMNNTRYLDWIWDLLPSAFHARKKVKELTVCYFSEGREGDALELRWGMPQPDMLQVDIHRSSGDGSERVFSARIWFRDDVL